jgi:hypothetical protein
MILGLFPILLIAIIAGVIYAAVRSRHRPSTPPYSIPPYPAPPYSAPMGQGDSLPPSPPVANTLPPPPFPQMAFGRPNLSADLDRWVAAGLLSEEQSAAIQGYESRSHLQLPPLAAPSVRQRRIPAVAEALGYLGGMLATIGLVLLVSRYWRDMATPARLALSGAGAVGLLGGGAAVREKLDLALARLRWFLWLAATAATALFTGVMIHDAFGVERVRWVVIGCAAAVASLSGILWFWRERPVQQITFLAGLAVFSGTLVGHLSGSGPAGLALWALGALFIVAALQKVTPLPVLTEAVGGATLVVGTVITAVTWPPFGLIFALLTGVAVLAIAEVRGLAPSAPHEVIAAISGGTVLIVAVPWALGYFAKHAGLVTGVCTWLVGAVLVYIGGRRLVRVPLLAEILGGLAIIGGAALTGVQFHGFAPLFGIATALGLVALGTIPGRVLMSVFGSLGLLINVPWAIGWFFPGEGRAPLLILVSGALIIAVAVLLTRMSGRLRTELRRGRRARRRNGGPPANLSVTVAPPNSAAEAPPERTFSR